MAAYILAAQTLLVGLAHGLHAAPRSPDAAGLVICTTEGLAALPSGDEREGSKHLPACCVSGCGMLAFAAPSTNHAAVETAPPAAYTMPVLPARDDAAIPSRYGLQGNPRAPPLTA